MIEISKRWVLNCKVTFGADKIHVGSLHFSRNAVYTANHAHSDAEVHIVTKGCKKFILDFDNEILLGPGQILLIGPNVFHEEKPASEEAVTEHSVCFYIKNDSNNSSLFEQSPYYHIEADEENIIECFMDMEKELVEEGPFCSDIVPGYITVIFGKLYKVCCIEPECTEKVAFPEPQKNIIDEYFNDFFLKKPWKYTAEELSGILHISQRHLNRILHELYGMNFSERLTYIKLKYAKDRLIHSDESVEQISEGCLWSTTHFLREFKRHYGITPSQFKENK